MKHIIVVTSGKGGVGKTTIAVGVGKALASLGNKVLLIDGDIGLRNIDIMLDVADNVLYDYGDILKGNCSPNKAIMWTGIDNLYLLAAPQINDDFSMTAKDMEFLATFWEKQMDYVIIDCPAGVGEGFKNAVSPADLAIVVTLSDQLAIRDADRAIGLLEKEENLSQFLIINRVRKDWIKKCKCISINDVIEIMGIDTLGIVPEDSNVGEEEKKSDATRAFMNIARRIEGETVELIKLRRKPR